MCLVFAPVEGLGLVVVDEAYHVFAGKSFLPRIYAGSGSFVLQIMLLKPL